MMAGWSPSLLVCVYFAMFGKGWICHNENLVSIVYRVVSAPAFKRKSHNPLEVRARFCCILFSPFVRSSSSASSTSLSSPVCSPMSACTSYFGSRLRFLPHRHRLNRHLRSLSHIHPSSPSQSLRGHEVSSLILSRCRLHDQLQCCCYPPSRSFDCFLNSTC
jgi:hypothetical protein